VTHGHGDHFGGAAYLAAKYGARVMMSAADWALAPRMVDKPWFDAPPDRDLVIKDGDRLTLGGTSIRLYITPGHTMGTVSMLIPVKGGGKRHMAALWGGTGFNFPHTADRFTAYFNAAQRFRTIALNAGADVPLSPHSDFDGAIRKIERLNNRKQGEPNPFVMGDAAVDRFLTAFAQCAAAYREQIS
jgi:metallo-beta-lactamase class B